MAVDWIESPLDELCEFLNRGRAPAYIDAGGILVLGQKCVRNQRVEFPEARRTDPLSKPIPPERLLKKFDILVNSTGVGTLGRVGQIIDLPEPATIDSHVTLVRANPERAHPHYLGFALRYLQPSIECLAAGSTGQTELNRDQLGQLLIPHPKDLGEQGTIASILGSLDDKIELNRRMNETLEATARAIFKSWFVDFDPVRAKMDDHKPAGMSQEIAAFFPDSFQDSPLGKIPNGWDTAPIAEHFDSVKGVSYNGAGLSESGTPLHNLNSIFEGGGYKYAGIKHYTGEFTARHRVRPGDVIVANTEQGHDRLLIGYAAIIPESFGEQGIVSHHLYRLRPKTTSFLTATYICNLLNSPRMHDLISGYANGTTVNMLPIDGLQKPLIIIPPNTLARAFDSLATNIEARRERLVLESSALAALRNALLPELISGRIRAQNKRKASSNAPKKAAGIR